MRSTLLLALIVLVAGLTHASPAVAAGAQAVMSPGAPAITASAEMSAAHLVPALSGLPSYPALAARYPGSDAVVLFDSLVITLDNENRISKRRHRAVMLFTDNAINRYGDPRILFNSATQELVIIVARVYMRDGTIVDTQKNGINQTTPFALALAPDYTHWQETVVTHVGIEKGCVAELHYVIADKNPAPYLSGVEVFSAEDPTDERVLAVKLPPGATLKFAPLSPETPAPDASTAGSWVWTVRRIWGYMHIDGGVWEGDTYTWVCYGTAASRKEMLGEIGADISRKASNLPADLLVKIQDRIKDCVTGEDKVLAVQRLAIESVTGIAAPYPLLAEPARDAARIYDSGYASALDRAVLLTAMLQEVKIFDAWLSAVPVLISASRSMSKDVPSAELFAQIAVSVSPPTIGELLLDPASPLEHDLSFALAGRNLAYLGPSPRPTQQLPMKSISDSESKLTLLLKPGRNGDLEGEGTVIVRGAFSPYYIVREDSNGLSGYLEKRVSKFFGGARLVSWTPRSFERNGAEIDFAFTVKVPDLKKGERLYLTAPKPFEMALSGIERVPVERSLCLDPIRIEKCILEVSCTIKPPAGWRMITEGLTAKSNGSPAPGSAVVHLEPQPDGTYLFRKQLVLHDAGVLFGTYDGFRSMLQTFGEDRIVLEKE